MSGPPVRIMHIVAGMNRGGVETWLMSVLRGIDRQRYQMDFVVHTEQECTYDAEIRELGSRIIPCMHPSKPWRYARNFRRIIEESGPYDVVHSHTYWFSGYVVFLAHLVGVRRRLVHVYPHQDLRRQNLARRIYRATMARCIKSYATGVLADSQIALEAFNIGCDCSDRPQAVVYPIVDLSRFQQPVDRKSVREGYGLPPAVPIVLYLARFYPHKNHRALFEIARRVNEDRYVAHFVMAGAYGPLVSELQHLAGTRADVTLLVDVQDVSQLTRASDLFVFPSLNEGFGIVAVEAQAAGLPVIASDLPSIREALAPELRSLVFRPDDLDQAASRIGTLLADQSMRDRLGQEGREWACGFSFEASMTKLLTFYGGEDDDQEQLHLDRKNR